MSERRARLALFATLIAILLAPPRATATQKFGPVQLSGNLQTQNLIRHGEASNPGDLQFVQQRNTLRVRVDYDWLQNGNFINRYDIPFIQSSKLFLLYRGVYDSIYDTTPDVLQKRDIHGRAYGGLNVFDYATTVGNVGSGQTFNRRSMGLNGLSSAALDAYAFENTLREWYADIKFRGIPLTLRAGRQQVVWGETDNFRMLDRVNPLDLTWHFQQEIPAPPFGWDEIRRPLVMFKFLYQLPNIWQISQNFLEWYWNPGDWYPAKQDFLPRPWALPFYNPLTNPIDGVFISGVCDSSTIKVGPLGAGMCTKLFKGQFLKKGDYHRNPMDNSQVGVRYHGMSPQGLEFTLNYFYQRWSGDDGTNYAPLQGIPYKGTQAQANRVAAMYRQGIFPAEALTPYVHTAGASANYSDEAFTQTVYRFETVFDVGIPFFDVSKVTVIDRPALPGVSYKNMWKGMIAFDRPTWVRWLNKKSTLFLTGQFFWHYLIDNPDCRIPTKPGRPSIPGGAQTVGLLGPAGKARVQANGGCLVGGLDLPSSARPGTGDPNAPAYRDKIRDWEALITFAAFSFYRGGSVIPILGIALDPVNQFSMEPFWTVDYFVTSSIAVNLAQRWFVTPRGYSTPIFETWGLAGLNSLRSETSIRLTYQF